MRCIETLMQTEISASFTPIKSNMRCIETVMSEGQDIYFDKIKSNMRCIETNFDRLEKEKG